MKKYIEIGINRFTAMIEKQGRPKAVELPLSDRNKEFISVVSEMKEYEDIQFVIADTEITRLAKHMTELGEILNANIEIDF